jgi:hypothetical protein
MGLRELLGLPPKARKQPPPQAPVEDKGAWTRIEAQYQGLIKDPRYTALPERMKAPLGVAWTNASMLSLHGKFNEATEVLQPAIVAAANGAMAGAKAPQVFAEAAKRASGLLDAMALLGVPADHVKAMRGEYDLARKDEKTDIILAAEAMTALAEKLRTDPQVLAAKVARDKVLSERPALEKEIETALKTPPETEVAARALRQLGNAADLTGSCVGHLDYIGAVAQMEICRKAIAELAPEAKAIADAIKQRDEVLKERAKLDAKVNAARLIYGPTPESEAVVKAFKGVDDGYYEAIKTKDYARAASEVKRLGLAADRVIELKALCDEDIRKRDQRNDLRGELSALFGKKNSVPAVTPAMEAIEAKLNSEVKLFDKAMEDAVHETAVAKAALLKSLFADYDKAAKDSAAQLKKRQDAQGRWNKDIQVRADALASLTPQAKPVKDAIAKAGALRNEFADAFTANDFDALPGAADKAVAALDEVDRLMKLDVQLAKDGQETQDAYNAIRARVNAIANAKVATPEFRVARDAAMKLLDEVRVVGEACGPGGKDKVAALEKAVGAAEKLKAASDGKAVEKRQQTLAVLKPGFGEVTKAIKGMAGFLPHAQGLTDEITTEKGRIDELYIDGLYDDALDAFAKLKARLPEAKAGEAGWQKATDDTRDDLTARRNALDVDFKRLGGLEKITPEFKKLILALTKAGKAFDTPFKAAKWPDAAKLIGPLETAVAALKAREADHGTQKADRDACKAAETRSAAKIDTAVTTAVTLLPTQDIRDRLSTQKDIYTRTFAARDFATAKAAWIEAERLLGLWDAALPGDKSAAPPEMAEFNRRWNAVQPDYAVAKAMTPVPKTLAPLIKAMSKAYDAFFAAFKARDWVAVNVAFDKLEPAVAALLTHEQENDDARAAAQPDAADALDTLQNTSVDDLKKKPMKERLELLDKLRGEGRELTDEERKAQRQVYAALDYDPEFKKQDKARRDRLVDEIGNDDEVRAARKGWAAKPVDDRVKVLKKVVAAECRIYGMPAPDFRLFNEPPGDEGFFSPSDGTLNINIHPESGFADFKEALNTVLHENMHNLQAVMGQRLEEGIIVPGDPDYMQALIFAANDADFGYVDSDEDDDIEDDEPVKDAYKNQPVEMHAWDTGDEVSEGIVKMGKQPKKGVSL